jgi:hypothetical protein
MEYCYRLKFQLDLINAPILLNTITNISNSDEQNPSVRDMLNKIIKGKIDANRRYIDEVLEKIQDANHRYYLEKLVIELAMMESEEKAGNGQAAFRHKVMVDTYKGILEKAFGVST